MEIPLSFVIVTGAGEYIVSELANTRGGTPDRIVLVTPGTIAWDKCDCGQFAQTITSTVSSSSFPTPANDLPVRGCGHNLEIVSVTASLLRCIPGPTQNDVAPSAAALLSSALILEEDRLVLRRAIVCYLKTLRDTHPVHIFDFTVGTAASVGPEGLCGGVEINYTFGINNTAMCC